MDAPVLIGHRHRQQRLAIVVVAAATLSVYLPTLYTSEFVALDDGQYVVQNDLVRRPSFEGVVQVFREVWNPSTVAGYYQPLTMVSLMGDALLSGPDDAATFHATNILLHAFNAVMVMLIVRAACGGFVIPVAVALLWGLHPIQVESVSWISQRKTVLATALALLAIRAHLLYGMTGLVKWRRLTLLAYVLTGLAKPTVMFLPFLLMLLDLWPLRRRGARLLTEKWPLWIVMLVTIYVAMRSQASVVGMGVPAVAALPRMVLLIAYNTMLYLRHLLWPSELSLLYAMPTELSWSRPEIALSAVLLIALMAAWITSWRWSKPLFVGLAAAGLQLALAVGPVTFMQSQVGDRFMYLPLMFLLLPAAAWAARQWRIGRRSTSKVGPRRLALMSAGVVMIALLTRETLAQQESWINTESLWSRVLRFTPDQPMANAGLASVRMDDAARLSEEGRLDEAEAALNEALALVNRAIASDASVAANLETRAQIQLRMNRPAEAVADARQAIELNLGPLESQGRVTLGRALIADGNADEARAVFAALLAEKTIPFGLQLEVQQSLANAAISRRDWDRAAEAYRAALSICRRQEVSAPHVELGLAKTLLERGDAAGAAELFETKSVRDEFPGEAQLGLAAVAALRGERERAFSLLRNALASDRGLGRQAARKSYFQSLHGDPRWAELLGADAATQPAGSQP